MDIENLRESQQSISQQVYEPEGKGARIFIILFLSNFVAVGVFLFFTAFVEGKFVLIIPGIAFTLVPLMAMYFTLRKTKAQRNREQSNADPFCVPKSPRSLNAATPEFCVPGVVSPKLSKDGRVHLSGGDFDTPDKTGLPKCIVLPRQLSSGEYVIEPLVSGKAKVGCCLAAALFWNGIISIFVWDIVAGFIKGRPNWFEAVACVPFVLVGLALLGVTAYFALGLRNPKPRLVVDFTSVKLGEVFRFKWELVGRSDVVKELRVSLKGTESATYRCGTSTCTDRDTFFEKELQRIPGYGSLRSGMVEARIPANSMHSFGSPNNSVGWAIELYGDIKNWPDVKENFPLLVLPVGQSQDECV